MPYYSTDNKTTEWKSEWMELDEAKKGGDLNPLDISTIEEMYREVKYNTNKLKIPADEIRKALNRKKKK